MIAIYPISDRIKSVVDMRRLDPSLIRRNKKVKPKPIFLVPSLAQTTRNPFTAATPSLPPPSPSSAIVIVVAVRDSAASLLPLASHATTPRHAGHSAPRALLLVVAAAALSVAFSSRDFAAASHADALSAERRSASLSLIRRLPFSVAAALLHEGIEDSWIARDRAVDLRITIPDSRNPDSSTSSQEHSLQRDHQRLQETLLKERMERQEQMQRDKMERQEENREMQDRLARMEALLMQHLGIRPHVPPTPRTPPSPVTERSGP
ncbi:hypothetical protein Scep_014893 [Stephania cephalantha]|uniref:Uncharacterized protein n=1 Tax=Stephania cephalantha TaxID=152367 RepID=A0AAP0J490_9MAGN